MKLLVCGGRDYNDRERVGAVLEGLCPTSLAHGGAPGADTLASLWAAERGIPCRIYRPDWARYGLGAGPKRNFNMLRLEKPDLVVAFPGGKGTKNMVNLAWKYNYQVVMID